MKRIVSRLGHKPTAGFDRIATVAPSRDPKDIYTIFPEGNTKPYDMKEIIECIVDGSTFDEFKADYGKTIVCGYARIEGWAVGIVANQRLVLKTKKGEMQMGGVIYNDSADKACVNAQHLIIKNQQKNRKAIVFHAIGYRA